MKITFEFRKHFIAELSPAKNPGKIYINFDVTIR